MNDRTGSIPDAFERSGSFVAIAKYFYMPVPIYLHIPERSGEYPQFWEIHGKEGLVRNQVTDWGEGAYLKWTLDQRFFTNIAGS